MGRGLHPHSIAITAEFYLLLVRKTLQLNADGLHVDVARHFLGHIGRNLRPNMPSHLVVGLLGGDDDVAWLGYDDSHHAKLGGGQRERKWGYVADALLWRQTAIVVRDLHKISHARRAMAFLTVGHGKRTGCAFQSGVSNVN